MHVYLARRLENVFREPLRELLKYKYRRLRFRGLARLHEQLQPKYKRRLKWQITDAALEARSGEAIAELDRIFAVPGEALDALYAPIRAYLAGDVPLARQKAQDLAEDESLDIQLRHGSFFLDLLLASPKLTKGAPADFPHIQYWDKNPPKDVWKTIEQWQAETGAGRHLLFTDESSKAFIKDNYGRDQLTAYENCPHASAKSDLVRFCTLHKLGGTYSDADSAPVRGMNEVRGYLTERPSFWLAIDLDFHARTWFLSTPPGTRLFEHFIGEATRRLIEAAPGMGMFDLAGPGMVRDVLFRCRNEPWLSVNAYTNFAAQNTLMRCTVPEYKQDARSWQVFEGEKPRRVNVLKKAIAKWR